MREPNGLEPTKRPADRSGWIDGPRAGSVSSALGSGFDRAVCARLIRTFLISIFHVEIQSSHPASSAFATSICFRLETSAESARPESARPESARVWKIENCVSPTRIFASFARASLNSIFQTRAFQTRADSALNPIRRDQRAPKRVPSLRHRALRTQRLALLLEPRNLGTPERNRPPCLRMAGAARLSEPTRPLRAGRFGLSGICPGLENRKLRFAYPNCLEFRQGVAQFYFPDPGIPDPILPSRDFCILFFDLFPIRSECFEIRST
jgi:hypothetical protein